VHIFQEDAKRIFHNAALTIQSLFHINHLNSSSLMSTDDTQMITVNDVTSWLKKPEEQIQIRCTCMYINSLQMSESGHLLLSLFKG
jgi:hypothetical protein